MRKCTFILVVFLGSIFMLGCQKEVSIDSRINPPTQQALLNLGDSAQGGIVYYILQPGDTGYDANVQHGLIAAKQDQGFLSWNNNVQMTYPITSEQLGTGSSNTYAIVNAIGTTASGNAYAAEICQNLVLNGYNDWYLPSKIEIEKLAGFVTDSLNIQNQYLTGFNGSYWSSTYNNNNWGAFFQCLNEVCIMLFYYPEAPLGVRAIRSF